MFNKFIIYIYNLNSYYSPAYFQTPTTSIAEGIIHFHPDLMFLLTFIILILFFYFYTCQSISVCVNKQKKMFIMKNPQDKNLYKIYSRAFSTYSGGSQSLNVSSIIQIVSITMNIVLIYTVYILNELLVSLKGENQQLLQKFSELQSEFAFLKNTVIAEAATASNLNTALETTNALVDQKTRGLTWILLGLIVIVTFLLPKHPDLVLALDKTTKANNAALERVGHGLDYKMAKYSEIIVEAISKKLDAQFCDPNINAVSEVISKAAETLT